MTLDPRDGAPQPTNRFPDTWLRIHAQGHSRGNLVVDSLDSSCGDIEHGVGVAFEHDRGGFVLSRGDVLAIAALLSGNAVAVSDGPLHERVKELEAQNKALTELLAKLYEIADHADGCREHMQAMQSPEVCICVMDEVERLLARAALSGVPPQPEPNETTLSALLRERHFCGAPLTGDGLSKELVMVKREWYERLMALRDTSLGIPPQPDKAVS